MKFIYQATIICFIGLCFSSCEEYEMRPPESKPRFTAQTIEAVPMNAIHRDTTYVSIYSDIYSSNWNTRVNLTAILSLRNTSFKHSIYISDVDYYDSSGKKDRSFLSGPLELKPMQSIEYLIEEEDESGGTGANFIINWASDIAEVSPIFEGIMIGTRGGQNISFTTQGVSVSNK